MFEYKSQEELQKMSVEELKAYHTAMKAHEANERKKEIEEATKDVSDKAVSAAKEAAKAAIDEAAKGQKEVITKEDFEKFKTQTNEQLNNIGKAAGSKETPLAAFAKDFNDQYAKSMQSTNDKKGLMEGRLTVKAWDSLDTMTVTDVPAATYPANGTVGIANGILGFFTRLIPTFFRKPRPFSKILNYITVEPTEGEISATVISEDYVGEAALTAECALKPVVKLDFDPKTVNYDYIAVVWKTSRILLRLFAKMGFNVQKRFNELLMEKIPSIVLDAARTEGVAFTADPAFKVETPNNFDAMVAVIAGLIKNGFVPNAIMISPNAYGLLITSKATDGHYNLSNGGSIQIIGGTLKYGEFDIELVQDPELAADEFVIGDLTLIHLFLESGIEYHQSNSADTGDFQRNIVSHVLETLGAVLIPNGAETGIVRDTFANVKTLITAA